MLSAAVELDIYCKFRIDGRVGSSGVPNYIAFDEVIDLFADICREVAYPFQVSEKEQ